MCLECDAKPNAPRNKPRGRPRASDAPVTYTPIEYLNTDSNSMFASAWYETYYTEKKEKMIMGVPVSYYVVMLPGGSSTSVEKWHVRQPSSKETLDPHRTILSPGTRVEVSVVMDEPQGQPPLMAWALAEVVEDQGGDAPVSVTFCNYDFWKPGFYSPDRIRISPNFESTRIAWNPPQPIIADREHLVSTTLQNAAQTVLEIEAEVDELDALSFERHRDTLIEIIEDLLIARYYDKATILVKFLKEIEILVAKRNAAPS